MSTSRGNARRGWLPLVIACSACLQWLVAGERAARLGPPWSALLPGACIVGAAFLLTWAAEAAELDIPQNLSIGIVALVAVMPEYAVDIYFAWKAGRAPAYTAFATANMTGANRLLIGLGWPAVLLACRWRRGETEIRLSRRNALELVTLLAATLYSFFIPFKATLSTVDSVLFFALYCAYAYLCSKSGLEEPELEGTAERIGALPRPRRRLVIAGLFLFAAASILVSAAPFAEGILAAGRRWRIEEFLLVQWLAPLASEAPEFIVAMLFAWKGKPAVGLRALLSSKVNQWTLLVGMLPLAYALSAGRVRPMPLDARQVEEIFLTSAQSLFGMALLMSLVFAGWEALALAALFVGQICFPQSEVRYLFAGLYLGLAALLIVLQGSRRAQLRGLLEHCFRV